MFDAQGREVWGADIDAYGDLRNLRGERQACPFRWPGQYEDEETGLYYNRFRYYAPSVGIYIAQDPIRLLGGRALYVYAADPAVGQDVLGLMDCKRAAKQAKATIEDAQAGKVRRAPKYHGRLPADVEADILANPEKVFFSDGSGERLIFYKDGNMVVTETGTRRGQVITSYGDKGPRGESGAAIFGGSPADPGLPINPADIEAGNIPRPDGGTLPPAVPLTI
jgi:RHS repeat-associated protein